MLRVGWCSFTSFRDTVYFLKLRQQQDKTKLRITKVAHELCKLKSSAVFLHNLRRRNLNHGKTAVRYSTPSQHSTGTGGSSIFCLAWGFNISVRWWPISLLCQMMLPIFPIWNDSMALLATFENSWNRKWNSAAAISSLLQQKILLILCT
jgi:hypothetical protein